MKKNEGKVTTEKVFCIFPYFSMHFFRTFRSEFAFRKTLAEKQMLKKLKIPKFKINIFILKNCLELR
jgi:hypothetical protein